MRARSRSVSLLRMTALAAALALPLGATAQQFVYDATALPAQSIWTDGVELADVDGDGDVDILFANGSVYGGTGAAGAQAQHLFLNDGTAHFTAAHAQLNVANFNAKMVIAEDFDNDGDLDLMYASGSTGSTPRLLLNQGGDQAGTEGVFADVTATSVPGTLLLRSFGICAGDVDDDGDSDVVVTDGGTFGGIASQARLLLNDGAAVFTDATGQLPVDLYNAQDVTLLDVDGDVDVDVALSGKGGTARRARLYLNDGTGVFSISDALNEVGTGNTYESDYGDFDGDADFDAAVQSISGFSEGWARNDGTATPWVETTFAGGPAQDDNEMACLDYDMDGDLDVVVGSLGSSERVYTNTAAVFTHAPGVIGAVSDSTLDLAFADLQGDGRYDLVTAQGESGNFLDRVYIGNGPVDTVPPVFVSVPPPTLAIGTTAFHAQLRDAISDDGHVNVTVTFSYRVSGGTGLTLGSGICTHMGGGLYRAPVRTTPGVQSVQVRFTATDSAGNVSNLGVLIP